MEYCEKMLDWCKVSSMERSGVKEACVSKILASIALAKDETDLIERIGKVVEQFSYVSIGKSLEELSVIASIPDELEYGWDGVDALCYHLSGGTCEKGIKALNKVLERFKEKRN